MESQSTIAHIDEACAFGARENVTFSLWHGIPTVARVKAQRALFDRLLRTHDKLYSLTLFRLEAFSFKAMADSLVRPEFDAIARMLDGKLAAHTLVVEGDGFAAATVRSAATSVGFVFRSRVVSKSFNELGPAVQWLLSTRENKPTAIELREYEKFTQSMQLLLTALSSDRVRTG
ncbi:MAG: hypothetical protein Q8Q09_20010 [Deltaproteobacteria bacterium]|nr:hypothetical protein [Deltaproteobacteria bacterium]